MGRLEGRKDLAGFDLQDNIARSSSESIDTASLIIA
jgi:hypothetical protein